MALRFSEELAQAEARKPRAFLRVRQARRAGPCPACHRRIELGDPVGVTWDQAWRCRDCAEVYSLIGPDRSHLLDPVERQIDARRIEIIMESHPVTRLWAPKPQGQES